MSHSHVAQLLEKYPALNSTERASLLEFARSAPLNYGAWKHFKRLFKIVEAMALSPGSEVDIQLLGILLARIDAAPIPQSRLRLKLAEGTPQVHDAVTVRSQDAEYSIGGRKNWYYTGFRMSVRPLKPASGGLRGVLEKLKLARAESATTLRVYDFYAHRYIGRSQKVAVKDGVLQIETSNSTPALQLDVRDPEFPFFVGEGPAPATIQYMKRRGRRLLRKVSVDRSNLYLQLLGAFLRELRAASLDPKLNWAAMDALFSSGRRWRQTQSGRGPYRQTAPGFVLKTREEAAPALWDGMPDFTRALFINEHVPIEANLTAFKVLVSNRQPLPDLGDALLIKFLLGGVPVLQRLAARQAANRFTRDKKSVSIAVAGTALVFAGARDRQHLQTALEEALGNAATPTASKDELTAALGRVLQNPIAGRRKNRAVRFLSSHLTRHVGDDLLFGNFQLFLEQSEHPAWILERVAARGARGDLEFLNSIAQLTTGWRQQVLSTFAAAGAKGRPAAKDALPLVTKAGEAQNVAGWEFLVLVGIEPQEARELWKMLARGQHAEATYRAAMCPSALQILRHAALSADDLRPWLRNPFAWFARLATSDFLQVILAPLPNDEQLDVVLRTLSDMPDETSVRVVEGYGEAAQGYAPSASTLRAAMARPTAFQWHLLAQSAVSSSTLRELTPMFFWRELNESAARVFRRAGFESSAVASWLSVNGALRQSFSPEFFLAVMESLEGEDKIRFIFEASEAQWQAVRNSLLGLVERDPAALTTFWDGILSGLAQDASLAARITGDQEMAATFLKIPPDSFLPLLQKHGAAHESLILGWLNANQDRLSQGHEILYTAAAHAGEPIRLWGLRAIRSLGIDLPVALRLMEIGLPQPFALGREHIESVARGSQQEQDYGLALCDSPNREVQEYGLAFLARRADTLLTAETIQKLAEHSDSGMQAWVAAQLETGAFSVDTAQFDTAVLRTRGKGRRAKESVKHRLDRESIDPSIEPAVLVEMARGSLARDREWALQQLAKRALNGEKLDGVTLGQ